MKDLMYLCGNYRVVFITYNDGDEKCFKVQFRLFGLFWITIKTFVINDFEDYDYCANEAEELFEKLIE